MNSSEEVRASASGAPSAIRAFTDLGHCGASEEDAANRLEDRAVVSLVRANWNPLSREEQVLKFGARAGIFVPVKAMAEADVCILPKVWDYYLRSGQVGMAQEFARRAGAAGKEVIVWNGGDLEAIVPIANAVTFFHGPHLSFRRANLRAFAIPQFKEDWLQLYYQNEEQPRKWRRIPSVGFCGWASGWNGRTLARAVHTKLHQSWHLTGLARYVPPSLPPPVVLRMKVLKILAAESRLNTHFLVRDSYRGGIQAAELNNPRARAKLEFVGNIWENDYTVCVRGVGNFSARFYETLCLGRIPILVNTDCVLPYDFRVNYRNYCVWIEEDEIDQLPQKLLEFHAQFSPSAFLDFQHRCRQFWLDYLCSDGFYRHFSEHFAHRAASLL